MKKLLFLILLAQSAIICHAQKDPLYSNTYENLLFYNPAICGSQDESNVWIDHRNQWFGWDASNPYVGEAPLTAAVAADININNNFIDGIGVNYYYDRIGFYQNQLVSLIYSKRFVIKEDIFLQFGFNIDWRHLNVNGSWRTGVPEPIPDFAKDHVFDFGSGMLFNLKQWQFGFSAKHLITPKLNLSSNYSLSLLPAFWTFACYKHDFGIKSSVTYVLITFIDIAKVQPEFSIKYTLSDKYFFSFGYRYQSTIMLAAGRRFFDAIETMLAYEIFPGELRQYTQDTYGVLLRYYF